MFLLIMVGIHAQNVRVTGVVSDAQGSLIGVNVHVKGGTTGVITDINGKYSIEIPASATLVFSYIGYVEQELKVGNKRVINVTLVEDSELLDEVVVVRVWFAVEREYNGSCSESENVRYSPTYHR